ncbi:hypothetical protein JYG23_03650 [Sedimentibacter sp. zth1]|uniref:hypothetical protein n=1 Tax=Sedimentibacter sp. zth1 TaxID=2816908 RepID=UPI001A9340D3|nr:hypothetical protein [Sedimentibacter sp. zth1]QSX06563.1 hypothetical protein JYG23_03650 [Sedimentibacter sp. zth1]
MEEKLQSEKYLTYDQMNIIIAVQKMWFKLAILVREYIRASIYDTRNLKAVTNNLLDLPSEAYNIFSIFYGTEIAQNVYNLFSDFIKSTMGVIEAMKFGDKVLTNSRIIKWYQDADELSSFLARINIYWDEDQWKYFLYQYIKIKTDEIKAVVDENDEVEMELFDMVENINFLMANYMGRGLISSSLQQIPN